MTQERSVFPEEELARQLHGALTDRLAKAVPDTRISHKGTGGPNWHCLVQHGDRTNRINCFALLGTEYLVSFEENGQPIATGRTPSAEEVISAVTQWMSNRSHQGLCTDFEFVDRQLRELTTIRSEALALVPELSHEADPELRHLCGDLYELWFQAKGRTCRVSYYGSNHTPDFRFDWDECEMFRIHTRDAGIFSALLRKWLCDFASPSLIGSVAPQIALSPVARYYEEGRPIEGEFICSWDAVAHCYNNEMRNWAPSQRMVALLSEMREAGHDRKLRAGQSMFTLTLSRSRRHGLRPEQPCISIDINEDGMSISGRLNPDERWTSKHVALTPELEHVLHRLEAEAIS